ncbi:ref-2-P [Drosophila busckii]|uniref:Protein ref(2)P n=1 Tax=Drosophila busckii TaxID=30019 RepID=A0A0M4EF49_DROBS|nr:ref-2-P [Drosophila busckii]
MPEKLLKISYNYNAATAGASAGQKQKLNAYLRMPSNTWMVLRREIEMYLFQERQLPNAEIRTYWIDADSDEIEIINQNDYEIFLAKCEQNLVLQVAEKLVAPAADAAPSAAAAAAAAADDPSNFVIHDAVQCDACDLQPIVGFRYKCIQCPNFDLCQKCEAGHKHANHMMVRMPNNNGPSVIDAWLSGPGSSQHHHHRRSSRRFRGQCPFGQAAADAGAAPTTPPTHKESRRERRHGGRTGGVFSQFVEMMMNLPESNTTAATATATAATATATADEAKQPATAAAAPEAEPATASAAKPAKAEAAAETSAEKTAEPIAAPRTQEKAQAEPTPSTGSTPTTPILNLDNLAQMVNPEYMRAGIEILNNFSEMFAKMIDPSESGSIGYADIPVSTASSAASNKSEASADSTPAASKDATAPTAPATANEPVVPEPELSATTTEQQPLANVDEEPRRRSESLDTDWQLIDNNASPIAHPSSNDALINLGSSAASTTSSSTDAAASPVHDFGQLGEMLRQHINQEQQLEQTNAPAQTSQVSAVSTSTTTETTVKAEENQRYHTDERINAAVVVMMSMGFSNEGAWLTQLLESVEGNIPAALDIMHTSQSGRN